MLKSVAPMNTFSKLTGGREKVVKCNISGK
jgi:hypothetical protein